ncbi:uncharacterized protein LOC130701900 [Daphnia carinata]|uniref:uncharacterized protein LOC130701900 n=1 Tax=Daphnia carinata TaxID=120202 RepID=UPI00257E845A|nr:uncharacterized protein LOC130701900 [Daphnia carinata]
MAELSVRSSFIDMNPSTTSRGNGADHLKNRQTTNRQVFNISTSSTCPVCDSHNRHPLSQCRQFRQLTVEKRAAIVKDFKACFRCLERDHLSHDCKRRERCSTANCEGFHHPLMHGAPKVYPPKRSETRQSDAVGVTFTGSTASNSTSRRTLLPIVPVILKANGMETRTFALLDSGSEISVLKRQTADHLGIRGRLERTTTKTVNGESQAVDTEVVCFTITSIDRTFDFEAVDVHVMPSFELTKRPFDLVKLTKTWPHLSHVPIHSFKAEDVAVLIGQDHPAALEIFETRKDPLQPRSPRAHLTAFGWYIAGPTHRSGSQGVGCFHISSGEDKITYMVRQFIEVDTFGTKPNVKSPMSQDEQRAWKILQESTKHNGERYECGLLWKTDSPNLHNNIFTAERRLFNLERRFEKDPSLAETYRSVIEGYVNLKHARKLSRTEIDEGPLGRIWYNAHHPVFNPNKPGKCRVVFDLRAKSRGVCLNDLLLKGPDLLTCLIGVLLRFRQYHVPLVADVEKMFHQVRVRSSDGPAFRFLWRTPGSKEPPDVYQMDVHLFGAASSPAVCSNALRQAVRDSGDADTLLPQVTRHFYVDNWLVSFQSVSEALSTAHRLTEALKAGGFPLTQWATSHTAVRSGLPDMQHREPIIDMDLDALPIERTLGLMWDFRRDAFVLKTPVSPVGTTKRALLRAVSSIFDPLGFLSPIVFQAKHLLQDVWRRQFDWDDQLDSDLQDRWKHWTHTLPSLDGLELSAAVLVIRLSNLLVEELDIKFDRALYWSDSTTVLSWIKSTSCRFNVYVGNRVGEILETSLPDQWHYVPSSLNPADDASRAYLRDPENWPKHPFLPSIDPSDPEIRPSAWIGAVQREEDGIDALIANVSRIHIIIRAVAYVQRWVKNVRSSSGNRSFGELMAEEIRQAKEFLLRRAQKNAYQLEIVHLQTGRQIPSNSTLLKLAPHLDHRGLLRVGGRIERAPLPKDARHPIILPPKERLTELILFQLHRERGHLSAEQLHHEARKQFWIPKGRITTHRVWNLCYICRRYRAKGSTPKMADLPAVRLRAGLPAFTHTGVDYWGPVDVTLFRRTVKRWGCLFTCLSSRSVHLEMAYSLDTSSFIAALDRFQNRRGVPASYHSDNGTNFVGAHRELAVCLENLNQSTILRHLSRQPTSWHFNPPASPHFGGVWERMVRAAKHALQFVLGRQRLADEILVTALTHVENILNSRKLTPLTEYPSDPECLTPNHLLLGRANPNVPPDVFSDQDLSSKKRWRISQAIEDQFWRRWMREIVPGLTERKKWYETQNNLEVGDIVIIIDAATPRGSWPLGRITEVFAGPDKVVRSAMVQVRGTKLHRPAHKLCLLESVSIRKMCPVKPDLGPAMFGSPNTRTSSANPLNSRKAPRPRRQVTFSPDTSSSH